MYLSQQMASEKLIHRIITNQLVLEAASNHQHTMILRLSFALPVPLHEGRPQNHSGAVILSADNKSITRGGFRFAQVRKHRVQAGSICTSKLTLHTTVSCTGQPKVSPSHKQPVFVKLL